MKSKPTAAQLANFERDPTAALLSMAVNTGSHRFSGLDDLRENQNRMDDDVSQAEIIEKLVKEIESNTSIEDFARIVREFQEVYNTTSTLHSCACCGIRTFQMDKGTAHQYIPLSALERLRYKPDSEALKRLMAIPIKFRRAISYFESSDNFIYHLHPEFVEKLPLPLSGDLVEQAKVCAPCWDVLRKDNEHLPKLSIANGIDFGVSSRIKLSQLRLAEQYLIARARLYVSVIKLKGNFNISRQSAKQGHVITFPQPESAELAAEYLSKNKFPRVHNVHDFLSVSFLGSRAQWDSLVPTDKSKPQLPNIHELHVRPTVVLEWLEALTYLNCFYENIEIDKSTEMVEEMKEIAQKLIDNVDIISDKVDIAVDLLASNQLPSDEDTEDQVILPDSTHYDPMPSTFVTCSAPIAMKKDHASRSVLKSVINAVDRTTPADAVGNVAESNRMAKDIDQSSGNIMQFLYRIII